MNKVKIVVWSYHEAIGEDLDTGVAEGGGGEFEVTEVAAEDLGGHGHDVVDEVDDDGRGCQVEKEFEFDPRGGTDALAEREGGIR